MSSLQLNHERRNALNFYFAAGSELAGSELAGSFACLSTQWGADGGATHPYRNQACFRHNEEGCKQACGEDSFQNCLQDCGQEAGEPEQRQGKEAG